MLDLYRCLLDNRRGSPALRDGSLILLDAPPGVLLFERVCEADTRVVAVCFADGARAIGYDGWEVDIASTPGPRRRFNGTLARDEAVILSPQRRGRRRG